MFFQLISPSAGELIQKVFCPVCLIDFVRVVEECMRITRLAAFESTVKSGEIVLDGSLGKMVHYVAFSSGGGAFHFLTCLAVIQRYHFPFSGRGFPFQFVFPDVGCKVDTASVFIVCHYAA